MAEWRERGYVPDSDEEEEEESYEISPNAARPPSNEASAINLQTQAVLPARDHRIDKPDENQRSPDIQIDYESATDGLHLTRPTTIPRTENANNEPTLKPTSTVERLQVELERGLQTVHDVLRHPTLVRDGPFFDRSVTSSPLSSIQSFSQLELPKNLALDLDTVNHANELPSHANQTATPILWRSLRQRNPIQLHPYALEDAKYQQQWRSRGLRPVRVNHLYASNANAAETGESQEQESYETDQLARSSSPVNPVEEISQSPIGGRKVRRVNLQELDVDELPDLSALLESGVSYVNVNRRTSEEKRRRRQTKNTSYSRTGRSNSRENGDRASAVFDVPPSPPPSRGADPTSRDQVDNGLLGGEDFTVEGLPTPLLSSDKPLKRSIVDISSESEEHFSSSSIHDEKDDDTQSHGLNRIQRRIRGVLPASWLKLDLKQQKVQKDRHVLATSPERTQGRGVAQRVDGKHQHPIKTILSWLSEDEDFDIEVLDEATGTEEIIRRGEDGLFDHVDGIGADGVDDDLVEEDHIDIMPALKSRDVTSRRRKKNQTRLHQPLFHSSRISHDLSTESAKNSTVGRHNKQRSQVRKTLPQKSKRQKRGPSRQQLTILDAPGFTELSGTAPRFLQLARRSARHPQGPRLQSPSNKTFNFGQGQDASDVHQAMQDWKTGRTRSRPQPLAQESRLTHGVDRSTVPSELSDLKKPNGHNRQISHLKTTTAKILSRIQAKQHRHRGLNGLQGVGGSVDGPAQKSIPMVSLVPLLRRPHKRHSGQGTLDYNVGPPRKAQFEAPQRNASRKLPNGLAAGQSISPEAASSGYTRGRLDEIEVLGPEGRVGDIRYSGPAEHVSAQREVSMRRNPKKQPPKRLPAAVPVRARPTSSSGENPVDVARGTQSLLLDACYTLNEMRPLAPGTSCDENSLVGRLFVVQALNLLHRSGPEDGCLRFHPSSDCSGKEQFVMASDENERLDGLSDVLKDAVQLLKSDASTQNSPPLPPASVRASRCVAVLEATIDYLNNTKSRPLELQRLSDTIGDSLVQFATASLPAKPMQISTYASSRILNRICMITFQLLVLLRPQNRQVSQVIQLRQTFDAIASQCLAFVFSGNGRQRVRSVIAQNQTSTELRSKLDDCPEMDCLIMCHHFYRALDGEEWPTSFNDAMSRATKSISTGLTATDLANICSSLALLCPLLQLSPEGTFFDDRQQTPYSAWSLVVPSMEAYLKELLASDSAWTFVAKRFVLALLNWCHRLAIHWHWQPPETLARVLVKIYNGNAMRAFFPDDRRATEFPKLVLSPQDRPFELEVGQTDFELCLKLIGFTLDAKRRTRLSSDSRQADRMRSFAFSLCPNTGHLLRGDEAISREDLASLINRSSLYIILTRYCPDGCKPRVSQIENLVNMSLSHESVWYVMLETWYVLVKDSFKSNAPVSELSELAAWLERMIEQMAQRHSEAAQENMGNLLNYEDRRNGNALRQANQISISKFLLQLLDKWKASLVECLDALQLDALMMSEKWFMILTICQNMDTSATSMSQAVLEVLGTCIQKFERFPLTVTLFDLLLQHLRRILCAIFEVLETFEDVVIEEAVQLWVKLARISVQQHLRSWDDYLDPHGTLCAERILDGENTLHFQILQVAGALSLQPALYHDFEIQNLTFLLQCIARRPKYLRFADRLFVTMRRLGVSIFTHSTEARHQVQDPKFAASLPEHAPVVILELVETLLDAVERRALTMSNLRSLIRSFATALKKEYQDTEEESDDRLHCRNNIVAFVLALNEQHRITLPVDEWFYKIGSDCLGDAYIDVSRHRINAEQPSSTYPEVDAFMLGNQLAILQSSSSHRRLEMVDLPFGVRNKSFATNAVEDFTSLFANYPKDQISSVKAQMTFIQDVLPTYIKRSLQSPYELFLPRILQVMDYLINTGVESFLGPKGHKLQYLYFKACAHLLKAIVTHLQESAAWILNEYSMDPTGGPDILRAFTGLIKLSSTILLHYDQTLRDLSHTNQSTHLWKLYKPFKLYGRVLLRALDHVVEGCVDWRYYRDDGSHSASKVDDTTDLGPAPTPSERALYAEHLFVRSFQPLPLGRSSLKIIGGVCDGYKIEGRPNWPNEETRGAAMRQARDNIKWHARTIYQCTFGTDVFDLDVQGALLEGNVIVEETRRRPSRINEAWEP